jgi:hypothetical protein
MASKNSSSDIEKQLDEYFKNKFKKWEKYSKDSKVNSTHGSAGALYFVGFIGALVYWIQAAVGFGAVVTGFLKALVWPAYVVYKLLENFYGIVI